MASLFKDVMSGHPDMLHFITNGSNTEFLVFSQCESLFTYENIWEKHVEEWVEKRKMNEKMKERDAM